MINSTRLEEVAVPVFLTQEAQQIAQQFAQQQPDATKAQQVQLNTLAICAVNNYFKILGIPSDPSNCDSWNPLLQMTTNVADLQLTGQGRIECRPICQIDSSDPTCYVPTEVQCDRMAYVVVQVDPEQPQAFILGFVDRVTSEKLSLNQLRPMSELPTYLDQHRLRSVSQHITQLTNWLQGQIDIGWQTLDELLGLSPVNYQWRSLNSDQNAPSSAQVRVVRGKVLDFSTSRRTEMIILLTELQSTSTTDLGIELKVLPSSEQTFLPAGLTMTVIDEAGESVMQAQARNDNRMIDLGFHAEVGDRFTLRLEMDEITIDEFFVI